MFCRYQLLGAKFLIYLSRISNSSLLPQRPAWKTLGCRNCTIFCLLQQPLCQNWWRKSFWTILAWLVLTSMTHHMAQPKVVAKYCWMPFLVQFDHQCKQNFSNIFASKMKMNKYINKYISNENTFPWSASLFVNNALWSHLSRWSNQMPALTDVEDKTVIFYAGGS